MFIRALHNSSVFHPESDEWDTTLTCMAVAGDYTENSVFLIPHTKVKSSLSLE